MEFDAAFFALAAPAVLIAGIAKGGFANSVVFAATPLLALAVSPGAAIGVMLPLLLLMDLGALRAYWRRWDVALTRRVILGAVPGVTLGAVLWRVAPADLFRVLIGGLALGFVAFQLALARAWIAASDRPRKSWTGVAWGAVGGLTSFVGHAGGPPVAVYILSQRLDKTTYHATTALIFWAINLLKVPPNLALGIFTRETLVADLWLAPTAALGVFAGIRLHDRVSEQHFFRLIYGFLVVAGVKLIYDGLT